MKIYEFGAQHDRTFVMFPCAAEPWWVFRESAEAMARDYHVYLVIADGAVCFAESMIRQNQFHRW